MANTRKEFQSPALEVYLQSNHDPIIVQKQAENTSLTSLGVYARPFNDTFGEDRVSVLTHRTSNDEKCSIATSIGTRNLTRIVLEANQHGILEVPQNRCPSCLESFDHSNSMRSCRHGAELVGNVHHQQNQGFQTNCLDNGDYRRLWKEGHIDEREYKNLTGGQIGSSLQSLSSDSHVRDTYMETNRPRFRRKPKTARSSSSARVEHNSEIVEIPANAVIYDPRQSFISLSSFQYCWYTISNSDSSWVETATGVQSTSER